MLSFLDSMKSQDLLPTTSLRILNEQCIKKKKSFPALNMLGYELYNLRVIVNKKEKSTSMHSVSIACHYCLEI